MLYIYISSQDGIPNGQVPTVDGRNPAQPGMHETLQIMGSTANLNWLAGFQPSTASFPKH